MSPLEPPFSTLPPDGLTPELDRSPRQKRTTAHFWIALLAGLCLVGFPIFFYLLSRAEVNANRGHLRTPLNMVRMGSLFSVYADTSRGNLWPGLADNERIWAPDLSVLYPKFIQDTSALVAIEHPEADHIRASLRAVLEGPNPDYETAEGLMALSFAYFGYAVDSEADFDTILQARASGLLEAPREAVHLPDSGKWVPPLNMDAMRCFGSNPEHPDYPPGINPKNPVLVEIWAWKTKQTIGDFRGANVLLMDGHVESVPLGTFPVVPSVMDGLCGVAPKD